MKKELSDEQFDAIVRKLMADGGTDEATVDQVAESHSLWLGVQRRISEQKDSKHLPWPPIGKYWRWLVIGVPATAAAMLLVASLVVTKHGPGSERVTDLPPAAPDPVVHAPAPAIDAGPVAITEERRFGARSRTRFAADTATKPRPDVPFRPTESRSETGKKIRVRNAEIKSEFIALSYARSPESGQIVRVRVPSSMMVSLGLVTTVEKPSALVEAEVLLGDDGTTHSIRFIR
jgi:hypothetical protein